MSLRIIKAGILDTIQDVGRFGAQHLGINSGGAMDRFSAQLANALLGMPLDAPVIEVHFPALQILFEEPTVIAICGADFSATINNQPIPLHHPIAVAENSLLQFQHLKNGARAYIAFLNELQIEKWKGSYSTNIKAAVGGFNGRALMRYDQLIFKNKINLTTVLHKKDFVVLPWKANEIVDQRNKIEFIIGSEWHSLSKEAQESFQQHWFQITNDSDRMGYRLAGPNLQVNDEEQLISSAVSFGTVQLLPGRQLIVLMVDHQTTGGYPRVAHIITAHLPILAQKKPNDVLQFVMTDLGTAEEKMRKQKNYLDEIQVACKYRMEEILVHS